MSRFGLAVLLCAMSGLFWLNLPGGQGNGQGTGAYARPMVPAERREEPYSGKVPRCNDTHVLNRIRKRFAQREKIYWHTGRKIRSFHRVRQIGLRSNGRDFIPRRYCSARARFVNGKRRYVSYWIGEDLGMIGWGWGVEWCIHGLDYNLAFAPNCRMARP